MWWHFLKNALVFLPVGWDTVLVVLLVGLVVPLGVVEVRILLVAEEVVVRHILPVEVEDNFEEDWTDKEHLHLVDLHIAKELVAGVDHLVEDMHLMAGLSVTEEHLEVEYHNLKIN